MVAEWNKKTDFTDTIRVKIPDECQVGDIIELRTLIKHPMETGNRKNSSGQIIPKNIIKYLKIMYDKQIIFSAEFGSGISENPYISFYMKVDDSPNVLIVWEDDRGTQWSKEILLNII